jgi:uncharacterized protein
MRSKEGFGMVDLEQVLHMLAEHRNEFRALGVRELSVFGSVARGEATETSDVDVLVDFEPQVTVSFFRICRLRYRLEDLLGLPVDVVTTCGLRPEIRDEVLNEAIRAAWGGRLRLDDMLDAAQTAISLADGLQKEEFVGDRVLVDAAI